VKGKGVSFMEGKHQYHGKPPTKAEAEQALAELTRTPEAKT
jgi:transketolase